jgi:hypothetical protein
VGARNAGFTHFGCREHDDPSTFGFFPFWFFRQIPVFLQGGAP